MDLPTCPACKQSVLDDDAVDCPFCGAPMKGGAPPARPAPAARGPAAKAPAQKSAVDKPASGRSSPAATRTSPATGSRTAGPSDETPAAEDDPFGVDPTVAANAIPVSRQQAPGKTVEVTCPMCETRGFISPKAAGKQVKCCNPQCMVPLFTAPAPEKKEVVAPPPRPKKKIPWLYIGGGIAFAATAGVCIWFIQNKGPDELPPLKPVVLNEPSTGKDPREAPDKNPGAVGNDVKANGDENSDAVRDAVVKQALARMVEVSGKVESQRKPAWRRLAVTAYVYAGESNLAREQLDLLERSSSQSPWEAIPPLVNLAWRNSSKPDEFRKTIDEAAGLAEKLPVRGRFATEASIALAPLLVAAGKADGARALLAKHRSEPPLEQLAAAVRVVIQDQSFNLDTTLPGRTIGPWQHPMATSVTLILASHGRWDDALAWAHQAEDPVAKLESTIAWAEVFLRDAVPPADATGLERAVAAGKDLSAEGQARLLARLAAVRFAQQDRAGAAELLRQAQAALETVKPPVPVIVEGVKPLLDLKLEPANTLKQQAFAAAEIAGVQARMGDAPRAWDSILRSMRYLSGIGPAMSPTRERRRQVDGNTARVTTELKRALGLKKDDEIRRAMTKYREKLTEVESAAKARFHDEVIVLDAAVGFGLQVQVWGELQTLDRKGPDEHQPLVDTAVSVHAAHRLADDGDKTRSEEIMSAVDSRIDAADPEIVKLMAERDLRAGNVAGCVNRLNAAISPHGYLHEAVLRLADRLVSAGKIADAINFCNRIKDPVLREEGLYLTAVLAGLQGRGDEFWKVSRDQGLGALESTSVCSGIILGLKTEAEKKTE